MAALAHSSNEHEKMNADVWIIYNEKKKNARCLQNWLYEIIINFIMGDSAMLQLVTFVCVPGLAGIVGNEVVRAS